MAKLTINEAQTSIRKVNLEISKLDPSAIISLFEIDLTTVLTDLQIATSDSIFRFHNHEKIRFSNIIWRGNTYTATPIQIEGMEQTGRGTLPAPKLSIAAGSQGTELLALLNCKLKSLGDMTGGKVTRYRIFAKHLDNENFVTDDDSKPKGFSPDPNAFFPPDIYFIDRKSLEDKTSLQFELTSLMDVEGIKLPKGIVTSDRCRFIYRDILTCGYTGKTKATEVNEKISEILDIKEEDFSNQGEWIKTKTYKKGDYVFITKGNYTYYFIAKVVVVPNIPPPDTRFWIADICDKSIRGCQLRFGKNLIPFGAYPALNSRSQGSPSF